MARLSRLKSQDKTLSVKIGEEVLNIQYNRSTYTVEFETEMREKQEQNAPAAALAAMVLRVVTSWDLEDYHPEDLHILEEHRRTIPVPLNQESVERMVPIEVLVEIIAAIAEDNRPKENPSRPTKDF